MVSARFGSSFHWTKATTDLRCVPAWRPPQVFSWIPNPMDLTALGCPGRPYQSAEHNGRCGIYDDKNGDLIVIKVIQIFLLKLNFKMIIMLNFSEMWSQIWWNICDGISGHSPTRWLVRRCSERGKIWGMDPFSTNGNENISWGYLRGMSPAIGIVAEIGTYFF